MHQRNYVHTRIQPASIRALTHRRIVLSRFTYAQQYRGPGSTKSYEFWKPTDAHYYSPERFRQITDLMFLSAPVEGKNYTGSSRIPPEVGPWDGKKDDVWGFGATVIIPLFCERCH